MSDNQNSWPPPIPDPSFDDLKQILNLLRDPDVQYAIRSSVLTSPDNDKISDEMRLKRYDNLLTAFQALEVRNFTETHKVTYELFGKQTEDSITHLSDEHVIKICNLSAIRVYAILQALPSSLVPDVEALSRVKSFFYHASKRPFVARELTLNRLQDLPEDF